MGETNACLRMQLLDLDGMHAARRENGQHCASMLREDPVTNEPSCLKLRNFRALTLLHRGDSQSSNSGPVCGRHVYLKDCFLGPAGRPRQQACSQVRDEHTTCCTEGRYPHPLFSISHGKLASLKSQHFALLSRVQISHCKFFCAKRHKLDQVCDF